MFQPACPHKTRKLCSFFPGTALCSISRILLVLLLLNMSNASDTALETISHSSSKFSSKLYKILSGKSQNIIFSPTSVEVVLALAHMGAKGDTAHQIRKGLELPEDIEIIKNGYNALMLKLKSTDDMILEIANKFYSDKTFTLEKEFQLVAEKSFLAAAEELDFKSNPENSRKSINGWVEKQTRSKIVDLLAQGDITADTRVVLVNAIYFKGKWKYPFNPKMTKPEPFYTTPTQSKNVDMMHIKKRFGYAELDYLQAKVLIMPYIGDKMSLMIILPNELDGLKTVESKLENATVRELMYQVDMLEVEVSLPRFKIEQTIELNEPLKELGMTNMFNEKADFKGLSQVEGVYVSKVVQKAFIEVNEEGSEAAAATVVSVRKKRSANFTPVIEVNHPFFVYLCTDTGYVIFYGSLSNIGRNNFSKDMVDSQDNTIFNSTDIRSEL